VESNVKSFNDELNELIATEVELNANPIDIALLEDLQFTPADMAALEPFVKFEEE
jgi:hypothetical protein